MADLRTRASSRGSSARGVSSGIKSGSASKNSNLNRSASKDLLSREEEYKRLNEELEAKTASLVREAEEVMKDQDEFLHKPSLLDNINSEEFLREWGNDDDLYDNDGVDTQYTGRDTDSELNTGRSTELSLSRNLPPTQPTSSKFKTSKPLSRPQSKTSNRSRPQSASKKTVRTRTKSGQVKARVGDDVAVLDDDAFMTDFRNFSLHNTITSIEGKMDEGKLVVSQDDDVMPSAAADMGAEAQIRFLKAKLRVMQEEMDRLAQDCNKKDEEKNKMAMTTKEMEEERNRLQRTNTAQQTQIDKLKRLADDAKGKAESLESELSSVRKELDGTKRSHKQQASSQSVTEVRLNRALEEVEKYKTQLQKARVESKDSSETEKRRVEQLMAENKRLEKQKNELMTGFKKQLKLIDILKRQKMHIEAAKMLAFTEEEFVKALEWGN